MKFKILVILLLCICIYLINSNSIEQFMNNSNMIEFTRLDGSLIKKIKIDSSYSLYDYEIINFFKQDDIIRINIPISYYVKIIYKFKNVSKGFGQTIELNDGSYDIHKYINDKIIYQIDIQQVFQPNFKDLIITDNVGDNIYTNSYFYRSVPRYIPINRNIYNSYYPIIPYYNYPRYNLYPPSKRLLHAYSNYNTTNYHNYINKHKL